MNHKRLRRLYCDQRLQVRPRKKRRVRLVRGNVSPAPTKLNEEWGLDFMHEILITKRKVRLLTIEDRFSREGLAVDPDFSISSRRVVRTLDDIAEIRGYPARLHVDNGPENVAGAMLMVDPITMFCCTSLIPGNPHRTPGSSPSTLACATSSSTCKSSGLSSDPRRGRCRFVDYNEVRPHSSLNYLTPKEFVENFSYTDPMIAGGLRNGLSPGNT